MTSEVELLRRAVVVAKARIEAGPVSRAQPPVVEGLRDAGYGDGPLSRSGLPAGVQDAISKRLKGLISDSEFMKRAFGIKYG